jgi:6-phosphogluconolactonase
VAQPLQCTHWLRWRKRPSFFTTNDLLAPRGAGAEGAAAVAASCVCHCLKETSMPRATRRSFTVAAAALAASLAVGMPVLAQGGTPLNTGKVFTSTNSPAGNELLVFGRDAGGALVLVARESTHGVGTGGGLGSQGAVTLSADGRFVFAVNAASNTVSTFSLDGSRAVLRSVVDSGGLMPTSVAEGDGEVYVLNAGGAGNVAGFRNVQGQLQPLADGVRSLSASGGTAPAQVGLGRDVLVVTERATNQLVTYRIGHAGALGAPRAWPSSGVTPFGFAFDRRDRLVVSEAVGGAAGASTVSSYRFTEQAPATPVLLSGSVPTQQTAACWIAITPNGRFAFSGNAGDSSVSSFRLGNDGTLQLLQPAAGITGPNAGVTDLAVSTDGRHLYALAPRGLLIASFAVDRDGTLAQEASATGLPAGSAGLAAN